MLIDRHALKILKAASTDNTRPQLNGLHVSKGHVEATNGHILAKVSLPDFPTEDCPEVWKEAGENLEGKILDPGDLKEVDRGLQKEKANLPILQVASIGKVHDSENDLRASWGLDGQIYKVKTIEGAYPNIDNVWPQGKVTMQVAIDPKYLRVIADLADRDEMVILSFRHKKETEYLEPVEFQCTGDRPIEGVIMPMRIKDKFKK